MRGALIVAVVCLAARAEEWQKPQELVHALALKRSDVVVVVEPDAFVAPLIAGRVSSVLDLDAPAHSVDLIVLYDVLHQVDRPAEFYDRLRRVLRIGGRIIDVDFSSDPPSTAPSKAKLTEAQAVDRFKAAGFRIIQTIASFPHQYFLVFE